MLPSSISSLYFARLVVLRPFTAATAPASTRILRKDADSTLPPEQPALLMLHKPKGVIVTRADEHGRKNVFSLLPSWVSAQGFQPAGRLDKDSAGLLLFAREGTVLDHITSPRKHIEKEYRVTVRGHVQEAHVHLVCTSYTFAHNAEKQKSGIEEAIEIERGTQRCTSFQGGDDHVIAREEEEEDVEVSDDENASQASLNDSHISHDLQHSCSRCLPNSPKAPSTILSSTSPVHSSTLPIASPSPPPQLGIPTAVGLLRALSVHVHKVASGKSHLTVVLREGKNRHIRRLFGGMRDQLHGFPLKVVKLQRVRIGSVALGDLAVGEWRWLEEWEVRSLGL